MSGATMNTGEQVCLQVHWHHSLGTQAKLWHWQIPEWLTFNCISKIYCMLYLQLQLCNMFSLKFLYKKFTSYTFWLYFAPFPTLRLFPPSYPPNFMFFLLNSFFFDNRRLIIFIIKKRETWAKNGQRIWTNNSQRFISE